MFGFATLKDVILCCFGVGDIPLLLQLLLGTMSIMAALTSMVVSFPSSPCCIRTIIPLCNDHQFFKVMLKNSPF